MKFGLRFALPLLLCLSTLLSLPVARAADGPADPAVWGVYAQLVGHRFKAPTDGWPGYEIVWSKPGEEIRESKLWFNTGEVEWTRLVRPGARAGELVATGTGEYNKTAKDWIGTVGADGSVSFALEKGLLKAPYRVTATNGQLKFEQTGAPPFAFLPEAVAPAATATASIAPAQTAADPAVWGAYAQLVGHRFKSPSSEFPDYEITWTKPGEEMRETALWWGGKKIGWAQVIRPGSRPGELTATGTRSGLERTWAGTIDADGAVLFVRDALIKLPYRVSVAANGSLEMQSVELKDNKLAAVTVSTPYTREGGPSTAATAVAATPHQTATPASSAAAATPATADPAVWGVYARLVGHRFKAPSSGSPDYEIVWSKPGEEMKESTWYGKQLGAMQLIRPGDRPGQLIATRPRSVVDWVWVGTIDTDGSVLFIRDSLQKIPYRVSTAADGSLIMQEVKLKDDKLAAVTGSTAYAMAGQPQTNPAPVAVIAATQGASPPAAGAHPNVTPEADPAVWGAYAQLVGHRFEPTESGSIAYDIHWSKPGEEMRETCLSLAEPGKVIWTRLIKRGQRPGELIAAMETEIDRPWLGNIGADGSVSFARQGFTKAPYQIRVSRTGELEVVHRDRGTASYARTDAATATPATASTPLVAASADVNWGVLEQLAGKTWQQHNTGRWELDTTVLSYNWSADRRAITLAGGDGYASRQIGIYRIDPATGRLISDTQDEDGKPIQAPVQVDSDGTVTVQLGKKRRSITAIHSESGSLKKTVQKLTWGGDWKDIETYWYFDANPGPEWGVFSKLAGYNWTLNGYVSLHFRWLPQSRVVEASIYSSYSYEGGIDYSQREGHPRQLVSRGEGSEYQLFGAPVGLTLLEGDTGATQISGKNRYRYELLSSPDRVLLHSEKWVDGELKKTTGTFYREDQAQKNERVAGVKRYLEARAASERTTRTLQNQAALYNALTAANEVAAVRVAQSQAELDATLDTLAEQAQFERMEAAAQQAAAEEAARQRAREREQDATVAAAMAQARQLAREAGDEGAVDRAIAETNRTIDQQAEARKQRIAEQEREARLNAQQQMKQFVQSSQAQQAQQARPQSAPKPAASTSTTGSASSVYMGCVAINSTNKVAYLSDIARIPMEGEQERWNAVFFSQHIARTHNLPERDFQNHCYVDRNGEAGASNRREQNRKTYTGYGFSIVEIDWSPEKRY